MLLTGLVINNLCQYWTHSEYGNEEDIAHYSGISDLIISTTEQFILIYIIYEIYLLSRIVMASLKISGPNMGFKNDGF